MEDNRSDKNNYFDNETEINFSEIFQTLFRTRLIIAIFSLISIIFSVTYSLTAKRIWEGNFQIVIEPESNNSPVNQNFGLSTIANLASISNSSNALRTEVEILKSPLLLNKIYEYVLKEKNLSKEDLLYEYWRDDIKIELQRNSTVLDISYRDSDKELILSTLKELSDAYQTYSGQSRLRDLELGIDYFKNQIEVYKNNSSESIARVQAFATENDFNFFLGGSNENQKESQLPQEINVEVRRLKASNNLRDIKTKLQQIKDLKDDKDFLKFLSKSILSDDLSFIHQKLLNIDEKLVYARAVYKENDKEIKQLEQKKDLLFSELKKETINFLNASKYAQEIILKNSQRSNDALIKYRQLITEAEKDLKTYDQLIQNYTLLELERARYKDPWRLISNPKLLNLPVAPRRKMIVLVSLITSLIVGSCVAYYHEKRSGIIYSLNEIIKISKWKLLTELSYKSKDELDEVFKLLKLGNLSTFKGKVGILILGNIEKEKVSILLKNLNKCFNQLTFILEQDVLKLPQYENIIAVMELGVTTRDEIYKIQPKLEIMKNDISYFFCISDLK